MKSFASLGMFVMLAGGSAAIAQNAAPPEDINPGVDTSSPAQTSAARPTARETPRPQDIDPAVDTSSAARSPVGTSATGQATQTVPRAAADAAARAAPVQGQATPAQDRASPAQGQAAQPAAAQSGSRGKALDRLELDTTSITGNRELPKVLYIVPWKRSDLGDLTGKPVNSLVDEVLAPIDRDVFQRENRYYRALTPGADEGASTGPDPKGAPQRAKPTNPLPAAGSAGSADAAAKQRSSSGDAAPASGNEK